MLSKKKRTSYLQRDADNNSSTGNSAGDIAKDICSEVFLNSIPSNDSFTNNQKHTSSVDYFTPRNLRSHAVKSPDFSKPKFPLMEKSRRNLKHLKHNRKIPKPRAHLSTMASLSESSLLSKSNICSNNKEKVSIIHNGKVSIIHNGKVSQPYKISESKTIDGTNAITNSTDKNVSKNNAAASTSSEKINVKCSNNAVKAVSDTSDEEYESFIAKSKLDIKQKKHVKKKKIQKQKPKNKRSNTTKKKNAGSKPENSQVKKSKQKAPLDDLTEFSDDHCNDSFVSGCHSSDSEIESNSIQKRVKLNEDDNEEVTPMSMQSELQKETISLKSSDEDEISLENVAPVFEDNVNSFSSKNNLESNSFVKRFEKNKTCDLSFANANKESLISYSNRPYESIETRCKRNYSPEKTTDFNKTSVVSDNSFNSAFTYTPEKKLLVENFTALPYQNPFVSELVSNYPLTGSSKSLTEFDMKETEESDIEIIEVISPSSKSAEFDIKSVKKEKCENIIASECYESFIESSDGDDDIQIIIPVKDEVVKAEVKHKEKKIVSHDAVYSTGICKDTEDEKFSNSQSKTCISFNLPDFKSMNSTVFEPGSSKSNNETEHNDTFKDSFTSNDDIHIIDHIKKEYKINCPNKTVPEDDQERILHGKKALTCMLDVYKKEVSIYNSLIQEERSTLSKMKDEEVVQANKIEKLRSAILEIIKTYPHLEEMFESIMNKQPKYNLGNSGIENKLITKSSNSEIPTKSETVHEKDISHQTSMSCAEQKVSTSEVDSASSFQISTNDLLSLKCDIDPEIKVEESEKICVVCGKTALAACERCAKVYYCSHKCGKIYWLDGHKNSCRK